MNFPLEHAKILLSACERSDWVKPGQGHLYMWLHNSCGDHRLDHRVVVAYGFFNREEPYQPFIQFGSAVNSESYARFLREEALELFDCFAVLDTSIQEIFFTGAEATRWFFKKYSQSKDVSIDIVRNSRYAIADDKAYLLMSADVGMWWDEVPMDWIKVMK